MGPSTKVVALLFGILDEKGGCISLPKKVFHSRQKRWGEKEWRFFPPGLFKGGRGGGRGDVKSNLDMSRKNVRLGLWGGS